MSPRTLVIACGALAREIAALRRANDWSALEVRCLPAELHNRPERIAPAVRAVIAETRGQYTQTFVQSDQYPATRTLRSIRTVSPRSSSRSIGPPG